MRMIDADALLAHFAEMQRVEPDERGREYSCNFRSSGGEQAAEWYTIEDAVENAPTIDAVPVVRCGECKHRRDIGYAIVCYFDGSEVADDHYCSYGERKENR